jgi:hypothetical protein
MNKKDKATYDIEWDSQKNLVRCRLNSPTRKTPWEYADVYDARDAGSTGLQIITRLERS